MPPASDRPGGANSKQPYITTPIPPQNQPIEGNNISATDFFLRGGINAARDTADDLIRLGKYFTDFNSVSGPLFVAKQNALSAIAVKTQATGRGTGLGLNEGAYTPLSTLAQAGINFIGGHVDKQGINPIKGVTTYSDVNSIVIGAPNGEGNRLVDLTSEHEGRNSGVNVLSYFGGPNSILGATNTNIKFATDNTGAPLKVLGNEELTESYIENQTGLKGSDTSREGLVENKFRVPLGASIKYTKNNDGEVIIKDGTAEAFIMGGDNEGTLAFINAENGVTWMNSDGTPPQPKLNNPTELFVYPNGRDALISENNIRSKYYDAVEPTQGALEAYISNDIDSSDGKTWRDLQNNELPSDVSLASKDSSWIKDGSKPNPTDLFTPPTGSTNYSELLGTPVSNRGLDNSNGVTWELQDAQTSVYISGTLDSGFKVTDPSVIQGTRQQNYASQTTEELNASANATSQNGTLTDTVDFRNPLRSRPGASKIMSLAPSYISSNNKTIDGFNGSRIRYTSPGQREKNLTSYTTGSGIGPIDKINAQQIYQSTEVKSELKEGDLVNFRMGAINQNNPSVKDYIHFRAYIDSFSDQFTSTWDTIKYMGRGENFYKYNGFDRKISLSFTVAAQSREELLIQYDKLNYLASNLAPTYSSQGYMGGNLMVLTLGNWCFELPGFIEGFNLDVPEESPWEIGIDDEGNPGAILQLPHIVKVSGFSFVPIHTFRPQKQNLTFDPKTDAVTYGPQKYFSYK